MSNTIKIIIVAVLVLAVSIVIILKQTKSPASVTQDDVQTKTIPRLIDLGAGKCIPCKLMAPILEQLKSDYAGKLSVQVIDIEENPDLITKYNVRVIPTQIFYDASGKELFRHEGFYSKEDILAKWKELGIELEETK
jgi:thioredoxin 1